jgi:hypothetical protein
MTAAIVGCGLLGAGVGYAFSAISTRTTVLYCIEGSVYERVGDTFVTVVPARSCLPVSKD